MEIQLIQIQLQRFGFHSGRRVRRDRQPAHPVADLITNTPRQLVGVPDIPTEASRRNAFWPANRLKHFGRVTLGRGDRLTQHTGHASGSQAPAGSEQMRCVHVSHQRKGTDHSEGKTHAHIADTQYAEAECVNDVHQRVGLRHRSPEVR